MFNLKGLQRSKTLKYGLPMLVGYYKCRLYKLVLEPKA